MPTGVRKCKVCGKEYPYCKTVRTSNVFRYQDVACCPEHGSIYFSKIEASRLGKGIKEADENIEEVFIDINDEEDEDDIDELFEEDFDDEDEDEI